jgi:hypothetical protein
MSAKTTGRHPHRGARWLTYGGIALINVLVLGLFAAYFSGQKVDLLLVIDLVGNTVATATGLLGIWYFFQAEALNMDSARTLQCITETVADLRSPMPSSALQDSYHSAPGPEVRA